MTNSNLTLPLSITDRMDNLNRGLATYTHLVESWAQMALDGDIQGDPSTFTAGLQFLSRSLIDGYNDLSAELHASIVSAPNK